MKTKIPLAEEALSLAKRQVETGRVRVTVRPNTREVQIEEILESGHFDIARVEIGREVSSVPETRRDGDTLVIPVVDEMLVVEKRLILREEIRITSRTIRAPVSDTVSVRSEEVVIDELPANPTSRKD